MDQKQIELPSHMANLEGMGTPKAICGHQAAAEWLVEHGVKVTVPTLMKWVQLGSVVPVQPGGAGTSVFYPLCELERFISGKPREASS